MPRDYHESAFRASKKVHSFGLTPVSSSQPFGGGVLARKAEITVDRQEYLLFCLDFLAGFIMAWFKAQYERWYIVRVQQKLSLVLGPLRHENRIGAFRQINVI